MKFAFISNLVKNNAFFSNSLDYKGIYFILRYYNLQLLVWFHVYGNVTYIFGTVFMNVTVRATNQFIMYAPRQKINKLYNHH